MMSPWRILPRLLSVALRSEHTYKLIITCYTTDFSLSLSLCVCVCLFCTCKIWIVFGLLGDLVQFSGGRSKFYCMVSVD